MKKRLSTMFLLVGVIAIIPSLSSAQDAIATRMTKTSLGPATHELDNTVVSAIMGAAVGGSSGARINKQMDKQASELKSRLKNIRVVRVAEGIIITIDSKLLFENDSHGLRSTKGILKDLVTVLEHYPMTHAVIEGHTDDTGEEIYNQSLSEERAHELETYFVSKGIKDARIKTRGYGESQPIASNDSETGRQANRRIEIGIYASEELREAALALEGEYTALKQ